MAVPRRKTKISFQPVEFSVSDKILIDTNNEYALDPATIGRALTVKEELRKMAIHERYKEVMRLRDKEAKHGLFTSLPCGVTGMNVCCASRCPRGNNLDNLVLPDNMVEVCYNEFKHKGSPKPLKSILEAKSSGNTGRKKKDISA